IADAPFLTGKPLESGFFQKRSEVDGIERLYAWRILEKGDLAVIIGQSTATIFNQYHRQRTFYVWSGGIISLLLLLAGYFFSRNLRQRTQDRAAIRQMKKALEHSQKMEALGNLTGGVAHDFNNILQIISGNTQMLKFICSGEERIEERLDNTLDAVDRGAKLSSQLLTFARRQPLRPSVIHLGALIQNIDGLIQRLVGSAIELRCHIAERLWNVRVDPNFLENVILNLAANARDAMQGKGTLMITVTNTAIDPEHIPPYPGIEPGDYVVLAITDTGPGMTPEVLERAFEPFFTTKEEGKGTGLGLAMAYGFVRESGGRIYLDSAIGAGTTVRIFLPRTTEQETEPPAIAAPVPTGGTETVLLVEDDAQVRSATEAMLKGLGYTVHQAKNADSALAMLKKNDAIDVLFTDVVMPGSLDGLALARQAKTIRPDVAILLTSGYVYDALDSDKQLDPQMEFLKKPYRQEELAVALRQALSRHRGLRKFST
ncbi:ATP-binding protein, partial [Oxalobacteraceae bacterium R-40]|nr:ATP-binding protein [Oxalobacteraceae bacterium R-40]